jgi:hypothetical protein
MNLVRLATPHDFVASFRVFMRWLQCFFVMAFFGSKVHGAEFRVGDTHSITITDVDQHLHSTSDGHITLITVVTRKDEAKAQMIGERYTPNYLGDPRFRLITVVNFQQKIPTPFRPLALAVIRYRLDAEAKELQKIYSARHLRGSARSDVLVVADFDGKATSQFGISQNSAEFAVFIFDGRGRLVRRWADVPSVEAFTSGMNEAL